jgi:glycosyltransferase involved in cell wall biosynthesis
MHVNTLYPPYGGGATVVCDSVCQRLAVDNEVSVFSGRFDFEKPVYDTESHEYGRVKVRTVNITGLFEFNIDAVIDGFAEGNCRSERIGEIFAEYLRETRPELVHFHSVQWLGANLIEKAREYGARVVLTMHDWWWVCARQFLVDSGREVCPFDGAQSGGCCRRSGRFGERDAYLRKVLECVDLVITPSRLLRDSVKAKGLSGIDIVVLENGVEKPIRFKPKAPEAGRLVFGYMGGDNWLKGMQTLLEAVGMISSGGYVVKLYGFDNPSADVIGNYLSGRSAAVPAGNVFVKAVRKLRAMMYGGMSKRLQDRLEFSHSFTQGELDRVLGEVDAVVAPSLQRESFSLVTREAMVRGIPVISSDSGGPEEIIKDGVNGFVFATKDATGLADRMKRFIEDRSLVDRLRDNIDTSSIMLLDGHVEELRRLYNGLMKV